MNNHEILAGINFLPTHSVMVGCLLALAGIVLTTAGSSHRNNKIRK